MERTVGTIYTANGKLAAKVSKASIKPIAVIPKQLK